MTVRRRILLAALAVGVVGTLVVLIWAAVVKDIRPRLEFTPSVTTNDTEKVFKAKVKNNESCTVILFSCYVGYEGAGTLTPGLGRSASVPLAKGESVTISFPLPKTSFVAMRARRWQVLCCVYRETSFSRFRQRLANLPLLNRIIKPPHQVWVESELFDQ